MGLDSAVERACTYTGQISLYVCTIYAFSAAENIRKAKGGGKREGKRVEKGFPSKLDGKLSNISLYIALQWLDGYVCCASIRFMDSPIC
jgi:hypothetical protein